MRDWAIQIDCVGKQRDGFFEVLILDGDNAKGVKSGATRWIGFHLSEKLFSVSYGRCGIQSGFSFEKNTGPLAASQRRLATGGAEE